MKVWKWLAVLCFATPVLAQSQSQIAPPDPFVLDDSFTAGYGDVSGKTLRSSAINPAVRTLVLITAGQSQWTTITPSAFTPTNASAVDNFNIYDGANYNCSGPLLGAQYSPGRDGNISARVADLLVTNNKFDRVIVVPVAIGASSIAQWDTGTLAARIPVAIKRLAARNITPATTGVTFALIWGQGESDAFNGTSQAAWEASFANIKSAAVAAGFSGRIFVVQETWGDGITYPTIRAAQAAVVDNVTVFAGGDLDTLDASYRQAGNQHFSDTGAAAAAALVYNAMVASGAPY